MASLIIHLKQGDPVVIEVPKKSFACCDRCYEMNVRCCMLKGFLLILDKEEKEPPIKI